MPTILSMDLVVARGELVAALRLAYSGEAGAAYAYLGHRKSLSSARHAEDRALILKIMKDEVRHRVVLRAMLKALGATPEPYRERKMKRIGKTIACFCQIGGWFLPMYGAARLERDNIVEYEIAAQLAWKD